LPEPAEEEYILNFGDCMDGVSLFLYGRLLS
jgi:hypothetical protein